MRRIACRLWQADIRFSTHLALAGHPRNEIGWPQDTQGLESRVTLSFQRNVGLAILEASNPLPKTIPETRRQVWALDGEFIRDLNDNPALRKKPANGYSPT
jgi:hypothetical protein